MKSRRHSYIIPACLFAAVLVMSAPALKAQRTWYANAGAESNDQAVQGDGFFPNEVWILAGDSIQWTFVPKNEIHTVTFLMPGQVRPLAPPPVGPPPGTPVVGLPTSCGPYSTPQTYTGTNCVSSAPVAGGATFKITFPNPGNFKMVCLVHTDMNGTVHVLPSGSAVPYNQDFYTDAAQSEALNLLNGPWGVPPNPILSNNQNAVVAGIGQIAATGGGTQYRAVVRFVNQTLTIKKGQSVTWTNLDPTEPHTVTFGTEPANFVPTSKVNLGVTAADGTLTGTISNNTDFLNSGFIQAQAPDRSAPGLGTPPSGDTQLPPGTTRITITFNNPGTYQYHCALHDVDGMLGTIIVVP